MSISTIRRADSRDYSAVKTAAERFCERHGIEVDRENETALQAIEFACDGFGWNHNGARMRKLWAACYCRALGVRTSVRVTIAYGYVGRRSA